MFLFVPLFCPQLKLDYSSSDLKNVMEGSRFAINAKHKASITRSTALPFICTSNNTLKDYCKGVERDVQALKSRCYVIKLIVPILHDTPTQQQQRSLMAKYNIPSNLPTFPFVKAHRRSEISPNALCELYTRFFDYDTELKPLMPHEVLQTCPW